ncbi:glyceraldehyde-3-phosphate dehydrogenase [Litoribacillus peritrichatus]|uniref:glyceraldehyde-3-phosphate dehydrogenase n=1 Tax=Litoribacillus peritrichatus TaxID=718191 RepID=UPI003CD0AE20
MTETHFSDWKKREEVAETMIPLVGKLSRDRNVIATVYGRSLVNRSVIHILKSHRAARRIEDSELSVVDTLKVVEALLELGIRNARIDVGKLGYRLSKQPADVNVLEFVTAELAGLNCADEKHEGRDVVLYGFGRIGRLVARILIEKAGSGENLRLRAIVVRKGKGKDLEKRASLLRRDSVHGSFQGTITVDEENCGIIANGHFIKVIYSSSPETVDYEAYGIKDSIVVDNTGIWRDVDGLSQHLEARGVEKAILTAPGKGDMKNIVYGINSDCIEDSDKLISAASCTTNAITPVLKAINDEFGIHHGHVETVHSYTNDQNLIDNYHSADRRGRSAPLNMVITETGAAKAVSKALPEMEGKLTGNAIRVPTPNVSMAILNLSLKKETTVEEVNAYLRHTALYSDLQQQVDYVDSPEVVSSDFVGSRKAGIVDGKATIVNGDKAVLYVWYDNEFGYSCQVVRILEQVAGCKFPEYK